MIKSIAPAQRHPTNRLTLAEFHHYWAESHGPLFANTKGLHRYVQHLSLPNAFGCYPEPTYDGVSMFWTDDDFDPSILRTPPMRRSRFCKRRYLRTIASSSIGLIPGLDISRARSSSPRSE
jgi:hypothetical protein